MVKEMEEKEEAEEKIVEKVVEEEDANPKHIIEKETTQQ